MSSPLEMFDDAMIQKVEDLYSREQARLIRKGRIESFGIKPGDRVIDIGTGPGFYASEIGDYVGPDGEVLGIDNNEQMLELGRRRTADTAHIRFKVADATQLPAVNESFDVAFSTQVFEYVDDVDIAIAEMYRVLRPGGRGLIAATDWTSIAWNSSNDERMERMLAAFAEHCAHECLPKTLGPRLRRAGFRQTNVEIQPIFESTHDPDNYSLQIAGLIRSFVPGRQGVTQDDAEAWFADLYDVGERDEHFFSINRFQFEVQKPVR